MESPGRLDIRVNVVYECCEGNGRNGKSIAIPEINWANCLSYCAELRLKKISSAIFVKLIYYHYKKILIVENTKCA